MAARTPVPRSHADGAARRSPPATAASPIRRMDVAYLGLWLAGTAIPLSRFAPWLAEFGFDLPRFVGEAFATRIGSFFGWDVVVSVVTLLVVAAVDTELPGRQRLAVAGASLLGASCGLPLYLLLRERRRYRAYARE